MSNSYFDFKKFSIRHDRCAMKVGTDAVLLGAWADISGAQNILDIGCGCGILSMMAAQRAVQASVFGIDIDPEAVQQARENAASSPFSDRIDFSINDVRDFLANHVFDQVLCNPPFYTEDTLPPDDLRNKARNSHGLPFDELVFHVSRLLSFAESEDLHGQDSPQERFFHVVIPSQVEKLFTATCKKNNLHLTRICWVKTTEKKVSKRCLCTYSTRNVDSVISEELVIMENGKWSEPFQKLTDDFYLDVPQSS